MKSSGMQIWSNASLRLKGTIVLMLPLGILAAALLAVTWMERETLVAERGVQQDFRTRTEIQKVLMLLVDAETGMRGYLLTGGEQFLEPYLRSQAALPAAQSRLAGLVSASSPESEPKSLREVQDLIGRELDLLSRLRALPHPHGAPTAAAGIDNLLAESNAVMDRLRAALGSLERTQDRRLSERMAEAGRRHQRFFAVVCISTLAGPLAGLLANLLLTAGMAQRIRRLEDNARLLAHGEPLRPAPSGKDEIARLGHALEEAAGLLNLRARRLLTSEQGFRSLFEAAPVAYQETDADGVIRRVNDAECRMLGYTAAELLGRPVWDLVAPEQQEISRESVRRKLSGEQPIEVFERDYVRKDGAIVNLEIHENPITDETGRITGLRSALLDISARRLGELATRKVEQYAQELKGKNEQLARALATAREATETKTRFLANMSHELRTPLNGIIGFSELMYDGKVGPVPETHHEFLGDILTSARHLLHLINDVLDLAKVESGRMEFRPERVDLNILVQEVRDILRPLADKKQVPILFEPRDGFGEITADAARFKQILYNYLSNAVKFTAPGGRVEVRLAAEGPSEFRVEVQDTGVGIQAQDLPRLFQDFQQLSIGRREEQGTGLGLALTKRIVEAQGGRVEVHSTFGRGSTFVAILPRILAQSSTRTAPALAPAPGEPRQSRILIIEDDPRDAARLGHMLAASGYQVQTACTAVEALAKCQAQSFDAITLDLLLPDRSGWELLRAIRTTGPNSRTPVIVVSLVAEKEVGAAFQIDNFLTKPVEASDLIDALERAGAPPYGSKTVLVIDDDVNTLKVMQATLTGFGYHPLCATNGQDGRKLADAEHPAAIILDLMMPVMDGFQFLEQFRNSPSAFQTPVIVWTNKDLTLEEYAQLEGLAQNVILKRDSNPRSILEQLNQLLPQPVQKSS